MLATKLTERLGKQVVVDNRAGASGVVASEIVAAAPPDGHTLMVVSIAHTANPVALQAQVRHREGVHADRAARRRGERARGPSRRAANSVRELLDLARKNPGKLHMAHAGIGTYQHMSSSLLLNMAGIDVVLVPFKGGGPATIDVVGGHSQILIVSLAQRHGTHQVGQAARRSAMSSTQRLDSLPDIPTIAEAGVPGYVSDNWWGIVGPAGIPSRSSTSWSRRSWRCRTRGAAGHAGERRARGSSSGPAPNSASYLADEIAKWAKVVKEGKIKLD